MTNSIPDLESSRCVFVIGSNTTETHPLIAARLLRAKKRGGRLIVADPRNIQLARFADLHVRQKPGTDLALINGMIQAILSAGWENQDFIRERTENIEGLKAKVAPYTPERVEEITGVKPADLLRMAEWYARAESAAIVYAMGITQHISGTDNVKSLANLAMLCGQMGREGTGVNPLRGQNNVQGACDLGCLPNVYTGYQRVDDPEIQKKFSAAWGVKLSPEPGLTLLEMMDRAERGELKALYILGENPLLSDPDLHHVSASLKKLELLVVQDIFPTETTALAHIVLPGASFAEKDGTFTNTERRVQRVRAAVPPPGEARPDWQTLAELLRRFGLSADYAGPEDIFREIAALTPSYAGISYARIESQGIPWPCPAPDHPGTPILHREKFSRGRGLFTGIDFVPPAESPDQEYPFILSTGRSYFQYHTGSMSRRSPSLEGEVPEAYVEIHPRDAGRLGIQGGDWLLVRSRRGEIRIRARLTLVVEPGMVFVPFHFAEAAANLLTNPARDPVAKIPEYKVCAAQVEKAPAPKEEK